MLRGIGEANTEEELAARVLAFTKSPLYTGNDALQRYWLDHWANCLNSWVVCYRKVRLPGSPATRTVL